MLAVLGVTQTAQVVALVVIHADMISHAYLSGSIFLDGHVSERPRLQFPV